MVISTIRRLRPEVTVALAHSTGTAQAYRVILMSRQGVCCPALSQVSIWDRRGWRQQHWEECSSFCAVSPGLSFPAWAWGAETGLSYQVSTWESMDSPLISTTP